MRIFRSKNGSPSPQKWPDFIRQTHWRRITPVSVLPTRQPHGLPLRWGFARLLTFTPVEATPAALQTLGDAGWSLRGIVTLAQLVAFVSFQSRLLSGLRLLNGKPISAAGTPVVAGYWHTHPRTASGKPAPVAFTRDELHWEPWIADKPLAEFNAAEQALLAQFGHTDSPYFRLLARNQPVLEQRTLTDKGIFLYAGRPAAR